MRYVYVIQSSTGHIKIGCSFNPKSRAGVVSSHSVFPARLIAMWPGVEADEIALHRQFTASRSHGEWFSPTEDVLRFAESVFGRGLTAVDEWADVSWAGACDRKERSRALKSEAMRRAWADPTRNHSLRWREERQVRSEIEAAHPDWDWPAVRAEVERRMSQTVTTGAAA
jgi:hypothetical protein